MMKSSCLNICAIMIFLINNTNSKTTVIKIKKHEKKYNFKKLHKIQILKNWPNSTQIFQFQY